MIKNCKAHLFYWHTQGNGLLVGKIKNQKFLKAIHQIIKSYAKKNGHTSLLFITNKAQESEMHFQ